MESGERGEEGEEVWGWGQCVDSTHKQFNLNVMFLQSVSVELKPQRGGRESAVQCGADVFFLVL